MTEIKIRNEVKIVKSNRQIQEKLAKEYSKFLLVWNLHFGITSLKKMESHFTCVMVQELFVENNSLCGAESQIKQEIFFFLFLNWKQLYPYKIVIVSSCFIWWAVVQLLHYTEIAGD